MLQIICFHDVFPVIYYTSNGSESNTAFLGHLDTLMYYDIMMSMVHEFLFDMPIMSANPI